MNAKLSESDDHPGRRVRDVLRGWASRPGPTLAVLAAYAIALVSAAIVSNRGVLGSSSYDFEVGQVADRDVVATRSVSYVDEEATARVVQELKGATYPVFRFDASAAAKSAAAWKSFADAVLADAPAPDAPAAAIRSFSERIAARTRRPLRAATVQTLIASLRREAILGEAASLLATIEAAGVVVPPEENLDQYSSEGIEIVRPQGSGIERERIGKDRITYLSDGARRARELAAASRGARLDASLASELIPPFLEPTLAFSKEESEARLEEATRFAQPVMARITRGERIVRKGFVVTEEELARLAALGASSSSGGGSFLGVALLLALGMLFAVFLAGPSVAGAPMESSTVYLLSAFSAVYLLSAALATGFRVPAEHFPVSVFLPTALLAMLTAVIVGSRTAVATALLLPYGAFVIGAFDANALVFAVAAGGAGVFSVQGAERRMDLVRAGAVAALAQVIVALGILVASRADGPSYPSLLFWSAFNGFFCGMAVLGFLPLLEQALNAPTLFRLVELSDLNSPLLKRLLTAAPGTYSHSVMVANLAETACRDIGANALLARVGGYYHDIGKMDQPDYFIENQAAYNKHDEIQPRLSATVIKSHVKVGIEKARKLRLPREVVDIIAEHHGNSVISWFYNEAVKREEQVNPDDFSYPGVPPRTRESATVMLADSVEAAARTLKKPTVGKLEKFVWDIIMAKFEQGQLSESELTFRDLETIKNAFVRALAGHYHSRIEYPKVKESVR